MGWKEEEIGDFGGGVLATVCFFSPGFETLLGRKPPTTMSAQPDKGLDDQQGDKGRTRGEFQRHQHQHGWSRVERDEREMGSPRREGGEDRFAGTLPQKFTTEAADDPGDPAELGPRGLR